MGRGIPGDAPVLRRCPRPPGFGVRSLPCYLTGMDATALLDEILDPFTRCLDAESAQRVVEFGIDPAVQQRVGALAERANQGVLTEDERADYEALINAADFIAILKLKAQRRLTANANQ